jgi:hypothetical protein
MDAPAGIGRDLDDAVRSEARPVGHLPDRASVGRLEDRQARVFSVDEHGQDVADRSVAGRLVDPADRASDIRGTHRRDVALGKVEGHPGSSACGLDDATIGGDVLAGRPRRRSRRAAP